MPLDIFVQSLLGLGDAFIAFFAEAFGNPSESVTPLAAKCFLEPGFALLICASL